MTKRYAEPWQTDKRNRNYRLRDLESFPFLARVPPDKLRDDLDRRCLPLLKLVGYKQPAKVEAQRNVARQCLQNLILSGLRGACVGDSRNTSHADVRLRLSVWQAIEDAGLLVLCKGSQDAGKTARYEATEKLLAKYRDWAPVDLVRVSGDRTVGKSKVSATALVMLKKDGEPAPFPPDRLALKVGGISALEYLQRVENQIEKINRVNLSHAWHSTTESVGVDGKPRRNTFQPSIEIRQIHSEQVFRYARNYTGSELSAQNLTKQQRREMRIDGQPTAELDFSGFHTRMLYHLDGIDPDPDRDVYLPRQIMPRFHASDANEAGAVRDLVKRATNICWNTLERSQAVGAVRKLIHDSDFLAQVMRVERLTPDGLIERVYRTHPKLAHYFFTEVSRWLMTFDGWLMLRILERITRDGRAALGIHDSVVCKEVDADVAAKWMRECYVDMFGFEPAIRRLF